MNSILKTQPTVRPMTEADLPEIAVLDAQCYPYPWTLGNFADSMQAGYRCCIYEADDEIIGYAVMMLAVGEAHLLNITIAPAHQGQGWGRALMLYVIERARQDQAESLWLEVRPSNVIARHLYDNMGFDYVSVRKNYYPAVGGREDAVIMRLDLHA
ncbi:MAG: ribosomal protein S18-alanine N-acetyltransferase [Sulfuriferula sp.]|nr:ribosomal protein S18-alanine N-acetyltransferase [Sulfuriferula sp.]